LAELGNIGHAIVVDGDIGAAFSSQLGHFSGFFDRKKRTFGVEAFADGLCEYTRSRPKFNHIADLVPVKPVDHHANQAVTAGRNSTHLSGVSEKVLEEGCVFAHQSMFQLYGLAVKSEFRNNRVSDCDRNVRYHVGMQIPNQGNRRSVGANMTPMIDVVFLLIIFFLVSSHLARQENRLPLELPVASTFDPVDPDKAPLTISVDQRSRWLVSGDVVGLASVRAILSDLKASQGSDAAIRIRTDGTVQYQEIEPLLREAALAGISDTAIAVREEAGL
jgi:biopolymer transport protein ExbD